MGHRPHVAHDIVLRAEDRPDAVTGVVGPVLHGDAALQHGADALAQAEGGVRPHVPDRREDGEHVGAADRGDGAAADVGKGVALQGWSQSTACLKLRQPARFRSTTVPAASPKVGMSWRRRLPAKESPPARASVRLARAC